MNIPGMPDINKINETLSKATELNNQNLIFMLTKAALNNKQHAKEVVKVYMEVIRELENARKEIEYLKEE